MVTGQRLPRLVEITVQDSGIGIDAENYDHIFEKFGRLGNAELHSSGKSNFKGGGAGLGLTIARGIFEAHGGSVWAESRDQDEKNLPGAAFHLLLPVRNEPPEPAQHRAALTAADCRETAIPALTYKE